MLRPSDYYLFLNYIMGTKDYGETLFVLLLGFNKRAFFLPITFLFLVSCARSNLTSEQPASAPCAGMKKISASGQSFFMGTNDSLANFDEKPAMKVDFSYDYWLDATEVTQGNYAEFMGANSVPDTSSYGKGDALPVYYVSWFDAALFCNARSKKLGLDTVFSFFSISKNSRGTVTDLVGLRIHYERDGIRLPTEAEWEFAAREASSKELFVSSGDTTTASFYAWYVRNSNGKAQITATKSPNALGLYDLAGNVFEWTADWKAAHVSHAVTDPIGAEDHDNDFEKVLKGGSFEHDLYNLRPTCRSATYPTAASAACEYVGFRCARGIIPNPCFVSPDTAVVATNPADLVLTDMRTLAGTSLAKLAFVNVTGQVRTLCYVDYEEPHPQIREFSDMSGVYMPAISPNGRYAAFCTQNVGFGDSSFIYVRSLDSLHSPLVRLVSSFAYMPRWWVNPSTKDTFLVYTNSAIDNSLTEWNKTLTMQQKMTVGKPFGDPIILVPDGSFHDGISVDGHYAATGFTRLLMRDLKSSEQRQLFVSPLNGKFASGSTQVCNVSICPDSSHTDRCLFLDFGSSGSTLIGGPYDVHQYLFIADFSGNVISWFKYPDGENSWDFPKWSTHEGFAVATARDAADESRTIYCIDFLQGSYTKLAAGVSLEQPYLWIGEIPASSGELDVDSLGLYDDPMTYQFQNETTGKMELFWRNYPDLQIVFLGNSQMANGIDCSQFTGYKVLNMGYAAGGILGLTTIVRQYILPNCPRIKLIGYNATTYWLNDNGGDVSWAPGIAQSKGFNYDLHHNFWKLGKPQGFDALITQATHYFPPEEKCGLANVPCQGWGADVPSIANTATWTLASQNVICSFDTLQTLINQLSSLNIHFLVVNFPESPAYRNTSEYNISGLSWSTGEAVMEKFGTFEQGNPFYHFYDAYSNGNHDYADSEACNVNHLCPKGARKLSIRIDSLINTFLTP
jgi:uncharacterized protein (TIGR02171 family)